MYIYVYMYTYIYIYIYICITPGPGHTYPSYKHAAVCGENVRPPAVIKGDVPGGRARR